MSFDKLKDTVDEGDTVILYLGRQSMLSFQVDVNKTHQTKFGAFPHKDLIGKTFGTKVYSKNGKGFVYILHPSPELWTVTLPHRTQILYTTDISQITMELDLRPGSIVVESGTGSGSLSHSIVRAIKPTGHLHTFDFHEKRVESAREEFESHGISQYITSKCADACTNGFGLENCADAVFLDLPKPWDAIPHAKKALKKSGGRICSFSPCIEQVQRSCTVLRKLGFCEIKTIECLVRTLNVRTTPMPEANTCAGLKELTRDDQNMEPKCKVIKKDVNDTTETSEILKKSSDDIVTAEDSSTTTNNDVSAINKTEKQLNDPHKSVTGVLSNGMVSKLTAQTRPGNINVLTSKPGKQMPGHTGYLTFASLYPQFVDVTLVKEE